MDNLTRLLRSWSERRRPGREHIDLLAGKISRSVEGLKPGDDVSREPAAPRRVKLGYALSGALVTAAFFLVFVDGRGPEDIAEMVAEEPEAAREIALRSLAEPARRRMEPAAGIADREVDALETAAGEIFPRIETGTSWLFSLRVIAKHLAARGRGPIGEDVVRIARQPMGVAARSYEINLQTWKVIVCPGTHDGEEPWVFRMSDEGREKFLALVEPGDFFAIPHWNERIGLDGTWYFIEADVSGRYHWILHWGAEEEAVLEIFRVVEKEADTAKRRPGRDE